MTRILLTTLGLVFMLLASTAHSGASDWIDIHLIDGHLYVESEISGVTGYSLLDTGAEINAINGNFIEANNLEFDKGRSVRVTGIFSESKRDTYKSVHATMLGTVLNFRKIVDLDFGSPEVQLILGAPFLERYVIQFDYPNRRMRLIDRDTVNLKDIKNVDSRKNPEGGSPLLRVGLNETTNAWLTMDTGANGGLLIDRRVALQLDWVDTYAAEQVSLSGVNSSGTIEEFRVPSIQLGEFEIENPLVMIPASGKSMAIFETEAPLGTRIAARAESSGLLGFDILQFFVVTVDYKAGHVHLYPGEKEPTEAAADPAAQ